MRAFSLALLAALGGCTCNPPSKPAGGSGSARASDGAQGASAGSAGSAAPAAGSGGSAAGSPCNTETAIRVSRVLTDPAHPCRARIQAAYGRMVRVGDGFSGTIVSAAAAHGAGLLVTCRSCAGIAAQAPAGATRLERGAWLLDPTGQSPAPRAESMGSPPRDSLTLIDPQRDPPLAIRIGAPARLADGAVPGGGPRYAAHPLFGADEVALAAIGGDPIEPGAAAPAALGDRRLALDDPRGLAASVAPFLDIRPGASALVLGFADAEGGELVASVGPVLADDEARRLIARAAPAGARAGYDPAGTRAGYDPAGTRAGYDPASELAIAARAVPGMIGGGVFDERGRFVGVVVRAEPVDGVPLVRAARGTAIAARLSAALGAAPVPLRLKIVPFLP